MPEQLIFKHPGFELRQINGRTIVRLRVRPGDANTAVSLLKLPGQPLRWSGEDPASYWLGPDQWLLTSDTKPAVEVIRHIDITLSGQLHAAVDMSSAYRCFELTGPAARTILAMGCGVDMHSSAFVAGHCTHTHFANVLLFIAAIDVNSFNLYVDRSYARYLCDWLEAAGGDPMTRDLNYQSQEVN